MTARRLLLAACCFLGLCASLAGASDGRTAYRLDIDGPIGPATSDYIVRGIERAEDDGAELVLLRIDTPGGLDTSMRAIIRAILSSTIPVVAYVAPSGAHAASAGTYILYASPIAAMAPGTNLGAATPVQIGAMPGGPEPGNEPGNEKPDGSAPHDSAKDDAGAPSKAPRSAPPDLRLKAINDAVAYIRSLAQLRGRNVDWAEKAVLEAASLSAEDALKENVINIIAPNETDLMAQLDGREVVIGGTTRTLSTAGIAILDVAPDWRTRLLSVITDPNVASILMMIGIYGLIFEFYSPGLYAPGVIGAICLLLALYAFHVLPIDYGGLALLILGVALMVAEAFAPSFGALGIGGLAAFVIGSVMLIDSDVPGFQPSWAVVGSFAIVVGGLFAALMMVVMRARQRPVVTGPEQMAGTIGPVVEWRDGRGHIRVRGELWEARSSASLGPGDRVRVVAIDGLTLDVQPAPAAAREPNGTG
jgi:membrane-bound serine protease (ClpP class)